MRTRETRVVTAVILILFAACSCSPERVASWSAGTQEIVGNDEGRVQGQTLDLLDLEWERYREEATLRRAEAGLDRQAKCPRCYRTVYLTDTAKEGDKVRCEHCGKSFVLE